MAESGSNGASESTIVAQLATFAVKCRDDGLPERIATDAIGRTLDIVGLILAAGTVDEGAGIDPGDAVAHLVARSGGRPEATGVGLQHRVPAAQAALLNGTLAHSLDFDDTHLPSVLHPSASVVPAALAMAEAHGSSGAALLAAVAVGDEICNRLGMGSYDSSINNSLFFEHGLHATSICGTIGSAAAAAMLLGLDEDGIRHAMGIAASMGAGLIEANRTGGTVKRVHCGWAAHSGITAAEMASYGVTGPPTVFEGRFGFYEALSRSFLKTEAVVGELGERWEQDRMFYKPYPANHFTHFGIDAALHLRAEYQLDYNDIVSVQYGAPASTLRTIGEPADEKARPKSGYHGKFSGPFTFATALTGGGGLGVYLDDFTDELSRDPDRLRIAGLVKCFADEEATANFPHQFGGVVRVTTRGGTVLEHRVRHNRGGPQNPLSPNELSLKFSLNAQRSCTPSVVNAVRTSVLGLQTAEQVQVLAAL
jgi:2-methylcitrate dehydratase PrpD